MKEYISGVSRVIQIFKGLERSTYKTYLKQVKTNTQDLGVILALKQFRQCKQYYKNELLLAKDMLQEYRCYVFAGHLLYTLAGNVRAEEDLVDYRKLKVE